MNKKIVTFVNDVTTEYTKVLVEKNPQQTSSYSYGEERISDGSSYYQTSRNRTVSSTINSTVLDKHKSIRTIEE